MARRHRYIALLRAINVGGHVVKMDRLCELFEALGFANVSTFIASGNVIFESPAIDTQKLERRIEKQLSDALGYEVATFIRTPAELEAAIRYQAFPGVPESCPLAIGFLGDAPDAAVCEAVAALRTEVDEFHVHGRELYWLCRAGMGGSLVPGKVLSRALGGKPVTTRNVTTVRKLATKYGAEAR
ncbi:MAG: hypothetical protein JWM41_4908 [Gemmatimonadetes bacterium]|nr:hypothetical protein [Gemmatimonadota bacterium]